ncbi:MAG: ATP-grasp domain-containing protein [Pseudorhodobacter sp.]|nr:ATP-grasp domain-containing protein [Rhizobacter sp.]
MSGLPRIGLLFGYDWDADGFAALHDRAQFDHAGFDLFSFPSNAHLIHFDLLRFARRQAERGRKLGWRGVLSHHEQFGALAAALVAEELGLPGATPESVLAAQHKLHAREVLQKLAPEVNLGFASLDVAYGDDIPHGLSYPQFVKPVKAAFSVLAREVKSRDELQAHTRFGRRELWVIRRLVEPFERVVKQRLPQAGTAHRMMLETSLPLDTPQYNLDGWVFKGQAHALGVVDAVMYPGTQAFMRWEVPSQLASGVQQRALEVAQKFLNAIGYAHGFFNMEFFHDPLTDRLSVIEFNPRMASQFADLYRRVQGRDAHAMSLALALGQDPADVPRSVPTAGAAASQVYRSFDPIAEVRMPSPAQQTGVLRRFPDALLFCYAKTGHSLERDFKWLGSYRHGIIHLGGRDAADLRERTEQASRMLGWRAPYVDSPQRTRGNEPLRGTAPPKSSVPCSSTSQPESIT